MPLLLIWVAWNLILRNEIDVTHTQVVSSFFYVKETFIAHFYSNQNGHLRLKTKYKLVLYFADNVSHWKCKKRIEDHQNKVIV